MDLRYGEELFSEDASIILDNHTRIFKGYFHAMWAWDLLGSPKSNSPKAPAIEYMRFKQA
jgi:hypothetical protein